MLYEVITGQLAVERTAARVVGFDYLVSEHLQVCLDRLAVVVVVLDDKDAHEGPLSIGAALKVQAQYQEYRLHYFNNLCPFAFASCRALGCVWHIV